MGVRSHPPPSVKRLKYDIGNPRSYGNRISEESISKIKYFLKILLRYH